MSAFILHHKHIATLVDFALQHAIKMRDPLTGRYTPVTAANADEAGQRLVDWNTDSVNERYGKDDEPEVYTHADQTIPAYNLVTILKACDSYDYQSCETEESYYRSTIHVFIQTIRLTAISRLPGYEEAPWKIS